MCLAIPARIISIKGEEAVAVVQGIRRKVVVSLIDNPRVGDCVLLHAGFAIKKWSRADLREYRQIVRGAKAR